MFKHLFKKHLSLFDKLFLLFLVGMIIFAIVVQHWYVLPLYVIFIIFILVNALKDMTIKHLEDLLELQFELLENMSKAVGGSKIVKTETIEFSVEKVSKAKKGNKSNEKPSNENTPNAGGSRSSTSRKRSTRKTANAKGTGTASVPNRKPKAPKKNSKA